DAIGGHTNAFTSMESTCYHAKVMDTHLEKMVDILSDIFLNSVFHADEIERERMVILQEIGMVEDAPEEYVHILSGNAFWGDHPLGRSILGTRKNINHFKPKALLDFFQRLYQPERIVVSAAGNLEHEQIVDLIAATFAEIKPGDGFPDREAPVGRSLVNIHYRDLEQLHLCIGTKGLSIIEPQRYAFSLLNTILGGNMSSRLFQEIRERRGLAYSVYTFVTSLFDTGMFGVYAGIDPSNTVETIDLICKEMRRQKEERVDAGELSDAKEFTKGSLMLASESVDNQMVRLAQNEIHFQKQIPLKKVVEKIESVSEEDIFDLAASLFQPDQLTLTLLGPVSKDNQFEDILIL
ncbi:MAG: pitrilysin family protein, partial [Desulfobacterales bacterium]